MMLILNSISSQVVLGGWGVGAVLCCQLSPFIRQVAGVLCLAMPLHCPSVRWGDSLFIYSFINVYIFITSERSERSSN